MSSSLNATGWRGFRCFLERKCQIWHLNKFSSVLKLDADLPLYDWKHNIFTAYLPWNVFCLNGHKLWEQESPVSDVTFQKRPAATQRKKKNARSTTWTIPMSPYVTRKQPWISINQWGVSKGGVACNNNNSPIGAALSAPKNKWAHCWFPSKAPAAFFRVRDNFGLSDPIRIHLNGVWTLHHSGQTTPPLPLNASIENTLKNKPTCIQMKDIISFIK